MSLADTLPPGVTSAPADTYPGKVFLFIGDPQELLDSGYVEMKIERRKSPTSSLVEVTGKPSAPRIPIEAGVYNYFFLDEAAKVGYQYQPTLLKSVEADTPVPQGYLDAVDVTFEYLLTIQELKDYYLFGQAGVLTDDEGTPFPDYVYAHYIRSGIAKFEQKTALRLLPTRFLEKHDFFVADQDAPIYLDEYPVLSVESVKLVLPGDTAASPTYVYPTAWIHLYKEHGQLDLIPDGSEAPTFSRRAGLTQRKFLPEAYHVDFFAGFALGKVPANLKDMVGKEASAGPLNLGGDLIGGAGIASQSISMDGLSTNINTTSSATNAGFGARLIQYNKELKEAYPDVIRFYKGNRMVVG